MMHSLDFMVKELAKLRESHLLTISKIDEAKQQLSQQSADVKLEIEESVASKIEALLQQKKNLLETVHQVIIEENSMLSQKELQIQQHVEDIYNVVGSYQLGDYVELRKGYQSITEEPSDKLEVGEYQVVFHVEDHLIDDAIDKFGLITIETLPKTGYSESDCFDYANGSQSSECGMMQPEMQQTYGKVCCELSSSCNCIDVCEEKMLPIETHEVILSSKAKDLDKWLKKSTSMSESCVPPMIEQYADEHVLFQLESLKLADGQLDCNESKNQLFEKLGVSKFMEDSQLKDLELGKWLSNRTAKFKTDCRDQLQRGAKQNLLPGNEIKYEVMSKFNEWDEICRIPLKDWLKPTSVFQGVDLSGNKTSSQMDEIFCTPSQNWLKDGDVMDIEDVGCGKDAVINPVLKNFMEICDTPLSCWLKSPKASQRKNPMGLNVMEEFERIKSSPLRHWLRREPSVMSSGVKLDERPTLYLNKWLKKGHARTTNASSFPVGKRHEDVRHFGSNKVTKSSGKLLRSDLRCWLKAPSFSSPKHDFCKWLTGGRGLHCSGCSK